MATKLLLFLSAFLAVQAFAWGKSAPWASHQWVAPADAGRNVYAVAPHESEDKPAFELVGLHDVAPRGNPLDCIPEIKEAYTVAKEAADFATKCSEFGRKIYEDTKTCLKNADPFEKAKCVANVLQPICKKVIELSTEYVKLKPKVVEAYDKVKKCIS